MGLYINPTKQTKESWLEENGEIACPFVFSDCPSDSLPVFLVYNGPFRAAGICPDENEFNIFNDPSDYRPKIVYYVKKDLLKQFM